MISKSFKHATLLGTVFALSATQVSAEMTLRYAEGSPNRGSRAQALETFAEQVNERSNGDLKLEIHWAGALLKYSGILDGVDAGTVDMGTVLSAYEPNRLKALAIGDLPTGTSDPWVGMRAMYELMTTNDQIAESLADSNVVYLSNYTTSSTQLECTGDTRITSVDDFAGKRMRASAPYSKILDEFGATLVNVVYSEVYQALETGLADCSASYLYAMKAFKTAEVTRSVTMTNWGQIMGFALVMNKWTWDDLSEAQQNVLREAGSDLVDNYAKLLVNEAEQVLAQLPTGELGNEIDVIYLSPEERQRLLQKSDRYIQEWISMMDEAGFDGEAVWQQYAGLLEKYESELSEKGYPWERS